jgi:hypothetical protein
MVAFIPGVETPGLVLLSLRDKSDTSLLGRSNGIRATTLIMADGSKRAIEYKLS